MSESKTARDAALSGLVERGVISAGQAEEVRAALQAADSGPGRVRWTEIVGYIGGGLVLAGAVALVASSWYDLSDDARVALLAVLAAASVGGAMFMVGGPQRMRGRRSRVPDVRRRIGGVLLALSSVLAAFAVGVALDGDPLYAPPLVGLVVAAAGYAALPSAVGQVAVWGMSIGVVATALEDVSYEYETESLVIGGALLALGLLWAVLSALGAAAERRLGLGLGAALALAAGQFLHSWTPHEPLGYCATLAVAALCIAYYVLDRTAVLLVLGIIGVTVGVPEFVWDVTDGAIGAATVLLLAGGILLAASWVGLLVHRRGGSGGRKPPAAGPQPPPATGPTRTDASGPHSRP